MVISSSSKKLTTTRYRIRSSSFPSNPNPFHQLLQDHLQTLKPLDSAANISVAISSVGNLYHFSDEALALPQPRPQNRDIIDDLLDASLKLLDATTVAKDSVALLKEAITDLQSALRRRKDDDNVEELVAKYTSKRKTTMRGVKPTLLGLKRIISDDFHEDLNDDVLKGMRLVGVMSVSVHESLLTYLSTSPNYKCRGSRWRLVKRLMEARGEESGANELSDVDEALHGLLCGCGGKSETGSDRFRVVQERIERLESGLDGIESGLNGLFRQLIKTRASLLNVLSF